MSSGTSRLVYNTRERLISTDDNRAQAFLARAQQEAWRAQFDDLRANWRLFPGLAAQAQAVGAPLYGEVFSGLFVRPDAPTYLTVDPGMAMIVATNTPGMDDSPYWYVADPGVQAPGVLPFTPNATVGTLRWDVVECQPVDTLLESSNRDVYNPATGLFVPATLEKVRAARFTYRIRLGTPGSGFPGAAEGWLPLAVAAVRDGATGFDRVDFWDVRPLVCERVAPQPLGPNGDEGLSLITKNHNLAYLGTHNGYVEAEFAGYLAGGALRTSTPAVSLVRFGDAAFADGGDFNGVNVSNPSNLGPYALGVNDIAYLAALFPQPPAGQGFLPRWARYSEAPVASLGRRVPNGPRGILVITTTPPGSNNLYSPISFPTACQLGVPGVGPVLAYATTFAGSVYGSSVSKDGRFQHAKADGAGWNFNASTFAADLVQWALVEGVHYPPGAKALILSINLTCTAGFTVSHFLVLSTLGGITVSSEAVVSGYPVDGTLTSDNTLLSTVSVMRPPQSTPYPVGGSPDWDLRVTPPAGVTGVTFNVAFITVRGWEF